MTTYRLSDAAQSDIIEILGWTHATFGAAARKRYEKLLATALRDVARDPLRAGTTIRAELGDDVRSYHLRYSRERAKSETGLVKTPRHLLLYRALRSGLVGVGRVLHDSMEIERHLPADYGDTS
ncbi:type II toxin-antitoxin system RelE/ParE family toxin [Agrobacterium salinitolerans]|uniref:type II toxin-antitoxin system RelE/ParE family toxin n=1 Tax=Agrobacterium salinitolerans TaxID=1183413 RepID=UPI00098E8C6F|nr:type II toxin-antitoxin system RelE/ParE family toxin [Agrobacterium salinitolerans]OOO26709.1 plasmid stabilization protein ParE [Agrobacterium salinitolerans]PNQ24883.1 type II toxin-antitoxin system RelE/ParE family toxin [Rhizobium sp. YIC5082]